MFGLIFRADYQEKLTEIQKLFQIYSFEFLYNLSFINEHKLLNGNFI